MSSAREIFFKLPISQNVTFSSGISLTYTHRLNHPPIRLFLWHTYLLRTLEAGDVVECLVHGHLVDAEFESARRAAVSV